ncbi:MAG: tRNA lysidine(34) synthetase TilS [Sedimentisphaerales bacterium]|nr:tRNA lysidine(34) synthetase TilS [Sedimentisphaerales bacterium]
MRQLEQKVLNFISAEGLIRPRDVVLLACSGGADSTALLHIIISFKKKGRFPVGIFCAHINHRLRGKEARRDEDFVIEQCRKLGLRVVTRKINVREYAQKHKLSVESAARKLRIEALIGIAKKQNCTCIATAHQKNDNAETVLQRLTRGTGIRGLCGIWPDKQFSPDIRFIRPLLCVSRTELLKYLKGRKIKWCEDRTNLDCSYRRNFIRNRLLPCLQKRFKTDLVEQIAGLSKSARGFNRLVSSAADAVWTKAATAETETISLDLDVLKKLHPEVQIELFRRTLNHLECGEQDITERHYTDVLRLSQGAKLQLPNFIEAHRQGGVIIFSRPCVYKYGARVAPPKWLKIPGRTVFAGVRIEAEVFDYDSANFGKFKANKSNTVEWLDYDKLKLPLKVRFRKPGDRFWPLGLKAEKKIGKFLTNAKIPNELRQKLLIVEDSEKVIWLSPVRISERVKVTNRTKRILQLRVFS